MKKLLSSGLFLLIPLFINAQRDAAYYYTYKGRISFVNEINPDSVVIKVPTAKYLLNPNFRKKAENYFNLHFDTIAYRTEGVFCKKESLLGPVSSSDPALYLHHVFIDGQKNYKLIVQIGNIEKVMLIDITKIIFSIKKNEITIEFPDIEI
jgi:hypothetical protein